MDYKVLLTLSWHHGIPDGDESVSIILPLFDIEDQQEARRIARETMIKYGVKESSIKDDDLFLGIHFSAEIGSFLFKHPEYPKPFISTCTVEATFRYVYELKGEVYELQKLKGYTIIPPRENI